MQEAGLTLWAIEYVMELPPPEGKTSGLLCVPLPWEEGDRVRAAVMLYESHALARAGLEHYLARTTEGEVEDAPPAYRLVALESRELVSILKSRSEAGFEHVAINPIVSRYFPDADGYSVALLIDDFVEAIATG